jgi:hypothetical protein
MNGEGFRNGTDERPARPRMTGTVIRTFLLVTSDGASFQVG